VRRGADRQLTTQMGLRLDAGPAAPQTRQTGRPPADHVEAQLVGGERARRDETCQHHRGVHGGCGEHAGGRLSQEARGLVMTRAHRSTPRTIILRARPDPAAGADLDVADPR
jgi:hypothetical protein